MANLPQFNASNFLCILIIRWEWGLALYQRFFEVFACFQVYGQQQVWPPVCGYLCTESFDTTKRYFFIPIVSIVISRTFLMIHKAMMEITPVCFPHVATNSHVFLFEEEKLLLARRQDLVQGTWHDKMMMPKIVHALSFLLLCFMKQYSLIDLYVWIANDTESVQVTLFAKQSFYHQEKHIA